MSTVLSGISWSADLEGFNNRVSHQDELTDQAQAVYNNLLSKVRATLAPLSNTSVQSGINILSLQLVNFLNSLYKLKCSIIMQLKNNS